MAIIFAIEIHKIIAINDFTAMGLSERRALILALPKIKQISSDGHWHMSTDVCKLEISSSL
jgi:hypothetical protein